MFALLFVVALSGMLLYGKLGNCCRFRLVSVPAFALKFSLTFVFVFCGGTGLPNTCLLVV